MTDDADDDPQLKSLRAVWLAMPDEDPPERGLADLMAAARVKADEMAKPPLWQRIAAALRRPPMLALATVLVLIGGAVFIGQRKDKLEPGPVVDVESVSAPGSADVIAQPASPAPPRQEQAAADPAAAPAATTEAAPPPPPPPPPPPTTRRPRPAEPKSTTTRGTTGDSAPRAKDELARDKTFEMQLSAEGGQEKAISGGFAQPPPIEPAGPKAESTKTEAAPRAPTRGEPAADSSLSGAASSTAGAATSPSRATQYIAQAKSAAARGDCSVARTMMKRVAKEDAAAYRNALASDASLKKCVAAP